MFLAIVFKVLCRQFSRSWLSTYITCLNSTWLVYTAFTYCPCVYLKAKSSTTPSANLFLSGANSSLYATHLPPFPFLSLSLSLSHLVFAPTLVRLVSLLADGLIALKDLLPVWFPSFRLVSIKLHCCTGTRVYTRSDLLWPTPLFLLTLLLILARPLHLFSCIYLSPESSERIETVWSGSPRCATPVFFAKRKKTVKREKNRH